MRTVQRIVVGLISGLLLPSAHALCSYHGEMYAKTTVQQEFADSQWVVRVKLILFDNGTPAPLRNALGNHTVVEAIERGWDRLVNGELIAAAEQAGFDVLLTTGKNMRYQQNLKGRKIAFIVLGNQQRPVLRDHVDRVLAAIEASTPGSYAEVEIPFK